MIAADRVEVTTMVAVEPALAFAVFTEELDLWWRAGPRFRTQGWGDLLVALGGRVRARGARAQAGSL